MLAYVRTHNFPLQQLQPTAELESVNPNPEQPVSRAEDFAFFLSTRSARTGS